MRIILTIALLGIILTNVSAQQITMAINDSTLSSIQQLKEVVVSAEKRELSPTDIPTALTVVSENAIPGENNPDLRNISGIVPNFYMQEGGL